MTTVQIPFTEQQLVLIRRLAESRGTTAEAAVAAVLPEAVQDDLLTIRKAH